MPDTAAPAAAHSPIAAAPAPAPPHPWWAAAFAFAWLLGGIALAIWLIVHFGAVAVGKALETVGWSGLLAIALFHLNATTLMGLAWWRLRRVGRRRSFIWGRLLRDAGSEVLPLSQLGGYLLAARSVVLRGIAGKTAAASVIVDATIEFCAQIAFVGLGVVCLILRPGHRALVESVLAGLALAGLAATLFILLQRREGIFVRSAAARFPLRLRAMLAGAAAVQAELREITRLRRVWPSFLLHFAAWMSSAVEAWLALRLMGAQLDFAVVLVLESLLYATRSVTFLVPSAIGVQEGAYVVLGTALGLAPGLVLGLSLLKRGRDLVLGIPALLSWHFAEAARRSALPPRVETKSGQARNRCGPPLRSG